MTPIMNLNNNDSTGSSGRDQASVILTGGMFGIEPINAGGAEDNTEVLTLITCDKRPRCIVGIFHICQKHFYQTSFNITVLMECTTRQ